MVVGGILKGAKAAGRLGKAVGKRAAKKGVVRAAGKAAKIFSTAGKFAAKVPSKVKAEALKEIARRGGVKEAGKALVKKIVRDQAYAQSKKVVKNFIADSQNSTMERMKDDARKSGIALQLMKEAERKKLIPKGTTPKPGFIAEKILTGRDLQKENQALEKRVQKDIAEGKARLAAMRESRLKGLKRCATFEKNSRGENVRCNTFKKDGEPKWFKQTYCKTGETVKSCSNKRAALSGAKYYKQYLPEAIKGLPKNDPRRIKFEKNKK